MVDHLTTSPAMPLPPLSTVPAGVTDLAGYERLAPAHLPPASWSHVQEGAGAGLSIRDNRAAFDGWRLVPRALADLTGATTATSLAGGLHPTPILLAPVAYARLCHPDGELAAIRAATALDTGMALSTLSSVTLEAVADARAQAAAQLGKPAAPLWFQLYLQPRREDSLTLVRRAEQAGFQAIVLTIDAGVKQSGFTLPAGVEAANLRGMPRPRQVSAGASILFGTPLLDAVPGWDDLAWLRHATRLPVIVKGMAVGEDVSRLIDIGADGLILSNHGGRVLDGLPSALDLLPSVAAVAGDRLPLMIDGGVRTGTDIVKALCLGARAVMIGRPWMHALAVAGTAGVAHMLHMLRTELEAAMAQLGCPTLHELTPERLFKPT